MTTETPPETPPATPPETPPEEPPKTLTQAEVDKLMAQSKREKKAAEKLAEEAAARLKELEDAKLSEDEKHKRDLEEREAKIAEAEATIQKEANWSEKRAVLDKAGIPGNVAAAMRTYAEAEGPEDIAEAVATIKQALNPVTPLGSTPGGQGGTPKSASINDQIRELEAVALKSGDARDWARVNKLKIDKQLGR